MRHPLFAAVAAAALAVCARGQFMDVTSATGLAIPQLPPTTPILEGRGSAWADFNGDGLVDVIVGEGPGSPVRLYTNSSVGTFTPTIVHPATNLRHHGCVAADFDNDGDTDVYIAVGQYQPNLLLVNDGAGNFTEEAALRGVALTNGSGDSRCASWGDIDRDGWLDLYVGDVFHPGQVPSANTLYLSDGTGSFTDVTASSSTGPAGETLATLFHDYDHDGWLDIYNANDRGDVSVPNQLYVNTKYGPFSDQSAARNANVPMDGMGITVGDMENDGDWDVFVTNRLGPVLLEFDGATDAYLPPVGSDWRAHATAAGLHTLQVGWSCHFLDYDHDRTLDLFVVHEDLTNRIYNGLGGGAFVDQTVPQLIATSSLPDYSAALVDLDRDGDLDIFMPGSQSPSRMLRNDNLTVFNHLVIEPEGTVSNRDAIGLVAIVTVGTTKMRRMLTSGEGYLSDGEKILHFGVGLAAQVDEVELRWPSGTVNYLTNVAVNQRLQVTEPRIVFTPPPAVGAVAAGNFLVPEDTGLLGVVGFALNPVGEHVLPDGRAIRIPLSDPVFQATAAAANPWFQGSFGVMKVTGLPLSWPISSAWVALTGFPVRLVGVTISPLASGFVRTIHGPETIVIQ